MKLVTYLMLLITWLVLPGQDRNDWFAELDTTVNDTTKIELYKLISYSYRGQNYDSAFHYAAKGMAVANRMDYLKGKVSIWNIVGNFHFRQSDYDSAIYYYSIAYQGALDLSDSLRQGALLNNIGLLNTYLTRYDTSIQILLKARVLREKINDPRITSTLNNLGNAHMQMGDLDRALDYYKQALTLKEQYGQHRSMSNTLNNIGIILKRQERHGEAISFYKKSLAVAEQFDDKNKQANAYNNLAALYHFYPDSLEISKRHFLKSIALKEELKDKAGLVGSYNNYGNLLSDMGEYSEALKYIEKGEALSKEIGQTIYTSTSLISKAEALRNMRRPDEAYDVIKDAYYIKIDELTEDRNEKIAELETLYNKAKQEAEIDRLSLETDLQKAQLEKSRILMVSTIGGSALVIAFLIIFFSIRYKKQAVEKLAQELQLEALKKRFFELHSSPAELAVSLDFEELNQKLHNPLTEREFEVLKLSLEGKTNLEIGDELFISISTVKFHLGNTYSKIGVGNRKEAFKYMLKTS